MKLEILYQDEHLVVLNKQPGISVIPERFNQQEACVQKLLEQQLGIKVYVVHRLDKETSGVLCFAKTEQAHKAISAQFQNHSVGKYYAAILKGQLQPLEARIERGIIEHPTQKGKMACSPKGKAAITDYKVVQQWPLYSLVQVQIHTGRTHQIRVHFASLGHPVLVDPLYGDARPFLLSSIKKGYKLSIQQDEEQGVLKRLALHAYRLDMINMAQEPISIEAPLPKDMRACINQLDKQFKSK